MVRGANDVGRIMIKELLPRALGHTSIKAVEQQYCFLSTKKTRMFGDVGMFQHAPFKARKILFVEINLILL